MARVRSSEQFIRTKVVEECLKTLLASGEVVAQRVCRPAPPATAPFFDTEVNVARDEMRNLVMMLRDRLIDLQEDEGP